MTTNAEKAIDVVLGAIPKPSKKPETVEEMFEHHIQQARKRVEELCIKKAKLEALNMHKMPYQQIRSLLDHYPF